MIAKNNTLQMSNLWLGGFLLPYFLFFPFHFVFPAAKIKEKILQILLILPQLALDTNHFFFVWGNCHVGVVKE